MRRATALKVADTLAVVEVWLEHGRPRKRPGKPRIEAEAEDTGAVFRVTPWTYDNILYRRVSLVGAFKAATIGEGYSRYVRHLAEVAFVMEATKHGWQEFHRVSDIDEYEPDTRQLMRYARAARRELERTYGL